MGLLLESEILEASYVALFLFWLIFVYYVRNYDYWTVRGVPQEAPSFPLGSLPQYVLGRVHHAIAVNKIYQRLSHHRFFGLIDVRRPYIVVSDPELIREVLCKNFNHFTDRFICELSSEDYLSHNLVTMKGHEWREMRAKLTPAYTTCKMRMMFFLVKECSEQLRNAVEEKLVVSDIIDGNDIVKRFAIDVIGTCAFGLDIDTLSTKNSQFYKMTKTVMRFDFSVLLKRFIVASFPVFKKTPYFGLTKPEVKHFFTNLIRKTVTYRETNKVRRFDFLDLLIRIRQNESILDEEETEDIRNGFSSNRKHYKSDGMMIEQMAAEAYMFFGAGFESSSSVISFCLYELSCNHRIQDKVFQEVEEVLGKYEHGVSFQALQEMTYLDQVINETLRLYPPFDAIKRICTQRFKIPDSDVVVEEGVCVMIPVYSLHHDPRHYPDPNTFNPDRFSAENRHQWHPFAYLPFGEGPRMCIGQQFGMMLVKAAVVTLVKNYAFCLAPETDVPLEFDSKSVVLQPAKPLRLVLSRRTDQS